MFFAYDTPDDREPLANAMAMLTSAGFDRHHLRAYVLCGYPKDTPENADERLRDVLGMGAFPMAMLYERNPDRKWRDLQRVWARPSIISARMKQ